jgi:hypothetical protein
MAQEAAVRLLRVREELATAHKQGTLADNLSMDLTIDFSFVDFASRSNKS